MLKIPSYQNVKNVLNIPIVLKEILILLLLQISVKLYLQPPALLFQLHINIIGRILNHHLLKQKIIHALTILVNMSIDFPSQFFNIVTLSYGD